ncbi:hypothetical protein [Agriterribacter sp.]|uniref:hypothetical protein n=1 Tax=Agriterribacter sp. TaxID=2821509 RepID=UPI002BE717A7|nr:hypothetical protein [Agriterribacter sp.]HRP56318.1 hypothetical protein [Agriterribacter sp.]
MKNIFPYLFFLCAGSGAFSAFAQTAKSSFLTEMAMREDSMKPYAFDIVNAHQAAERFRADSIFTRMLVRALKEKHSFSYPFDSLQTISRLYAPDSSFRIFTWQLVKDEATFRRHGAIQMNTADGSLLLYPLLDKTELVKDINNAITDNEEWVGALYYKIIQTTYQDKNFYTLLGYDENSFRSTKKRIEVLTFNNGKPVFGGPFFSFEEDSLPKPVQSRFSIEYKKEGNGSIKYDKELDIIIFDHLIPENNQPEKKYTYIPDGDYEGFKWENGKWVHIDKVFTFKLQDGQAPVERPVREGKLDILPSPGRKKNR